MKPTEEGQQILKNAEKLNPQYKWNYTNIFCMTKRLKDHIQLQHLIHGYYAFKMNSQQGFFQSPHTKRLSLDSEKQ